MPHDLILVIVLAWVSGAQKFTQRCNEPFSTQTEVFQVVFEGTDGKCFEVCSILINQTNGHCHSP